MGKTAVALNLGAKLLEMKYKTLLLDCDITELLSSSVLKAPTIGRIDTIVIRDYIEIQNI